MNATDQLTSTEVWMLLGAVFNDHKSRWTRLVVERTGMPFSRFRALRRLESAPLAGRDLAERLGVDAPACSVIVADLAARGLVRKEADPGDGRRKILTITEQGRELMGAIRALPDAAPVLDVLTPDELAHLHRLLTTVQEAAR